MRDTVLMHGFTGSSSSWNPPLLDGLAGVVGPLVLVDLPGHGRHAGETDPASFTLARVFDDLSTHKGHGPADLVGYSMGGRLALAYAVHHPARVGRLVLESASPGLPTEAERAQRRASDEIWAGLLEAEGIETFVQAWEHLPIFETWGRLPRETWSKVRAAKLRNDPLSLAAALRGLGTGSMPSFWDDIVRLWMPVLIIAGEEDRKFVEIARRMAPRFPGARVLVVAGAGHTVHLEQPDAWLEAVTSFLTAKTA